MHILAFVAALLFFSSPALAQEALVGEWRVERLDGKALAPGAGITLRFADGRFSGKACNSFSGSYSAQGDSVSFGPAMATRMACPPPVMAQEQRLFAILSGDVKWALSGDRLTLTTGEGASLSAIRKS